MSAIDEESAYFNGGLRYQSNRDLAFECAYNYGWTMNKTAGTEASRNLVYVRFYVQYPLFE